jgi:hypothetical protein
MRDHAHTLSDFRTPTLSIECQPCARFGRYSIAKLIKQYGDAKLPELLYVLADYPKARSQSVYDRCKAVYGKDSRWSTRQPQAVLKTSSVFEEVRRLSPRPLVGLGRRPAENVHHGEPKLSGKSSFLARQSSPAPPQLATAAFTEQIRALSEGDNIITDIEQQLDQWLKRNNKVVSASLRWFMILLVRTDEAYWLERGWQRIYDVVTAEGEAGPIFTRAPPPPAAG